MEFKERLRDLRLKKGMKTKEVAQLVGISEPTYISYESRGSQPPYEVLCKIADVFDLSIDYLIRGKRKNQQFENIRLAGYTVKESAERYIVSDKEHEYNLPWDKLIMIEESLDIMQKAVCSKELVKKILDIAISNK